MNPYTAVYLMNRTPKSLDRDAKNCHNLSKNKTLKKIIMGFVVIICTLVIIAIIA